MIDTATIDPRAARLRRRVRELQALQQRVADELTMTRRELDATTRVRRSRHERPPCGTDEGYQWHRWNDRDNWPLPAADPCGCRAAHASREQARILRRKRVAA